MNDHKPLFSIIIPVYNASDYLEECLQSIMAQDFTDWEAIIVDDGSTDDSVAIAERFCQSDSRIKLFKSEKNSGRAYIPRLRAAYLAIGEYIVTIDADDKVSADLLSAEYKCIITYNADLVIPEMWKLEGSDEVKILPVESLEADKIWSGKDLVEHTLCGWDIPMAGFAARRKTYLDADRKVTDNDKISIFADELHSRWMLFMCSRVALCEARYYYRHNEASVTHSDLTRFIDSNMTTCDSLLSMTAIAFGENSATHTKAIENKFYWAVDLLRLINKSKLDSRQKTASIRRISSAMKDFDFSSLSERVSPRYIALMHLPMPLARIALKILDPIFTSKNGI